MKSTTTTLKPGCGFWDITRYPIGGKFRRLSRTGHGLPLRDITPLSSFGCTHTATADYEGEEIKLAFSITHTLEFETEIPICGLCHGRGTVMPEYEEEEITCGLCDGTGHYQIPSWENPDITP